MESVKSGYMTKCGKTVKSWKKRWFVLKANGFLYYYTDPSCKNEKGHVDIINCGKLCWWSVAEGEKLSDPAMESRTFLIVCSERTYTCVCDTDVECRSWLASLCKVHDGSEPPHYPAPTYPKSEPPPMAMTTAPPMHAARPQDALRPAGPPMPQHSPVIQHRGPPMPQPQMPQPQMPQPQMPQPPLQQPPPYTPHPNTFPRQPHPPPPPPDYRHSFVGPLPPQQPAYYPPPVAQPRYGAPPPQPRYCAPPPQSRPYYPPPANQPGPYAAKPPAYYPARPPPPGQFAPRPYVAPPQQPRVTQQQQTNVVVVRL